MSRRQSTHCFRPTTQARKARRGASAFACLGLAGASLLGTGVAHADPRLTGGVRAAFSLSDVKAVQEYDPRFGVGGGVFLQGRAWNRVDLRLEANFVQKGAKLTFSRSSIEWQMDYVEVPLLVVVNLSPKSKTSVELCGGVTYAFPLQRQIEVGFIGYDLEDFVGRDIFVNPTTNLAVSSVEDADLGFALGLGLSVPTGAVNFLVDVRYTSSLTDPAVAGDLVTTIGEGSEAVVTSTSADFSNRLFSFFVGFAFPFGSRSAPESE